MYNYSIFRVNNFATPFSSTLLLFPPPTSPSNPLLSCSPNLQLIIFFPLSLSFYCNGVTRLITSCYWYCHLCLILLGNCTYILTLFSPWLLIVSEMATQSCSGECTSRAIKVIKKSCIIFPHWHSSKQKLSQRGAIRIPFPNHWPQPADFLIQTGAQPVTEVIVPPKFKKKTGSFPTNYIRKQTIELPSHRPTSDNDWPGWKKTYLAWEWGTKNGGKHFVTENLGWRMEKNITIGLESIGWITEENEWNTSLYCKFNFHDWATNVEVPHTALSSISPSPSTSTSFPHPPTLAGCVCNWWMSANGWERGWWFACLTGLVVVVVEEVNGWGNEEGGIWWRSWRWRRRRGMRRRNMV